MLSLPRHHAPLNGRAASRRARSFMAGGGETSSFSTYAMISQCVAAMVTLAAYYFLIQSLGTAAAAWAWLPAIAAGLVAGTLWPATFGALIYASVFFLLI